MKKKINRLILWILIIMLTFDTSLSYASSYVLTPGTNTIEKSHFENGFNFTVDKTGIYSLNVLPIIDGYKWNYSIAVDNNRIPLAALKKDGLTNSADEQVYQLYSKNVPYFVFYEGESYTFYGEGVLLNDEEKYVTIRLGNPVSTESGEYYEATAIWDIGIDEDIFQYLDYASGVKKQENTTGVTVTGVSGEGAKGSLIEQTLTSLFVHTIGDGVMFLIGVAAGEPITIDKILFNEYSRTRLGFFTNDIYTKDGQPIQDKINPFLSQSGILPDAENEGSLNKFFNRFTYIAIIAYLIILLYMGIRIVVSSTGKGMAKYKKLFVDWVIGIIILFLFPYIIRYTIKLNDAIVSYIATLRNGINGLEIQEAEIVDYPGGLAFPFSYLGADASASQDYMSQMRTKALESGRLMYAICWFVMIKELVAFLFIYIKRMLITMFLIVIFPLVTISYAVDKIGDGKSQAFNSWFKEFFLNVFLQTFHAINYVVVMGIIFAVGSSQTDINFILVIIGTTYLAQGDKILRGIFSHMKGGGGGTVKDVASSIMATTGAMNMLKSSVSTIGNGFKRVKDLNNRRIDKNNDVSKIQEYKAQQKWDSWNLANAGGISSNNTSDESSVSENQVAQNIKVAFSSGATSEQLVNALSQLRSYSTAGGNTQRAYESELAKLDPEKRKELEDLMDQNDAVNGIGHVEELSETDINANLNVIIKNRKRKGNFAKLDRVLDKKGIDRKAQDKLFEATNSRKLDEGDKNELERLRSSICTKEDATRLKEIEKIDTEMKKIQNSALTKKNRINDEIKGIEHKLQNGRLSSKDRSAYEARINKLRGHVDQLEKNPISYNDRKKIFELNEQKKGILSKMTNKNAKLPDGSYNKADRVNSYLEVAKLSNVEGELTDEQKEIAEAQAIVDGSDSGEFTLSEIWKANKKIRKAIKTSVDKGVLSIIQKADLDPETKKTNDYFTAQLATVVAKNEKALSGDSIKNKEVVAEAKKVIVEEFEISHIYRHILDEAGLKIVEDEAGKKSLGKLKKGNIVADTVDEVATAVEKKNEEEIQTVGESIANDTELSYMKKKVFQERLDLSREITKVGLASITTPAIGLASASMFAGASSELKPDQLLGAAKLATGMTRDIRDKAVDFAFDRVDNTTNIVSGIKDSASKGEGSVMSTLSTILYGDDNDKGVQTRHITIETHAKNDNLTEEEKYRKKILEERKKATDRMNRKIEQFANGIENSASSSARPNRPLTQAERNRQIFDKFGNRNNKNNS